MIDINELTKGNLVKIKDNVIAEIDKVDHLNSQVSVGEVQAGYPDWIPSTQIHSVLLDCKTLIEQGFTEKDGVYSYKIGATGMYLSTFTCFEGVRLFFDDGAEVGDFTVRSVHRLQNLVSDVMRDAEKYRGFKFQTMLATIEDFNLQINSEPKLSEMRLEVKLIHKEQRINITVRDKEECLLKRFGFQKTEIPGQPTIYHAISGLKNCGCSIKHFANGTYGFSQLANV